MKSQQFMLASCSMLFFIFYFVFFAFRRFLLFVQRPEGRRIPIIAVDDGRHPGQLSKSHGCKFVDFVSLRL